MRSNGEINRVRSRPVSGKKGPGRPKKTWEECVKQDLKVCGLSEAGTQDRLSWRSSVKNSRQEPTPSNGSLPQSMAAPPARRVLGMRTRSFNKTGFDWLIDCWDLLAVTVVSLVIRNVSLGFRVHGRGEVEWRLVSCRRFYWRGSGQWGTKSGFPGLAAMSHGRPGKLVSRESWLFSRAPWPAWEKNWRYSVEYGETSLETWVFSLEI